MMKQRPQFGWATSGVDDTRSYGSVLILYSIYQWFLTGAARHLIAREWISRGSEP